MNSFYGMRVIRIHQKWIIHHKSQKEADYFGLLLALFINKLSYISFDTNLECGIIV